MYIHVLHTPFYVTLVYDTQNIQLKMNEAIGNVTWWGFSPALDFYEIDQVTSLFDRLSVEDAKNKDEICFLVIGAGDLRHVLKTISRAYRHTSKKLHFFVFESCLELYARDMLLMNVSLEPQSNIGLQDKTELFLEIYGNILTRKQTSEYIETLSNDLIKMVTDFDYLEKKLPVFDLSLLKFKERDFLEGIFKFWRNPDTKLFEAVKIWDLRVRRHLGRRYDTRMNAFDWDYQMRLVERGAEIINVHQYKKWRNEGIAFDIREATYDTPNKTLASGMIFKHEGERHARRGYWGDISISPYVTFGIECEEKSFFQKYNRVLMKTSVDVSEYNVLSMFYELENKAKYVKPEPQETEKNEGPVLTEITEEEEQNNPLDHVSDSQRDQEEDETQKKDGLINLENVRITFLPLSGIEDLHKKSKFKGKFDVVYFSNSLVHLLKEEITTCFAKNAAIAIESAKYMVELKNELVEEFGKRVKSLAENAHCKSIGKVDLLEDNFFYFSYVNNVS